MQYVHLCIAHEWMVCDTILLCVIHCFIHSLRYYVRWNSLFFFPLSDNRFSCRFIVYNHKWQHGRVVKASDSKSGGLCPRGFESPCCRYSKVSNKYAWMAEWSKAVDLSSILVRGVGSNPTSGIHSIYIFVGWLTDWPTDLLQSNQNQHSWADLA